MQQQQFEYVRDDAEEEELVANSGQGPVDQRVQNRHKQPGQILQKKLSRSELPQGLKTYIYSFLTLTDLMEKISRLSSKQREIIQNSEILDQPRSLKVIVTDSQEYSRYVTQITRYDHKVKDFIKITQSAYQIDFERLEYLISLLNGDLTVKIENFFQRDHFLINTIYVLAKSRMRQKFASKGSLLTSEMPKINFQVLMRDADKFETVELAKAFQKFQDDLLGFIQFDFQINKRTAGNKIIKTFLTHSTKFTRMKVHSYVNFLEADSLETEKVERIEKLSLSFFESSNKLNGIIGKFQNLKSLQLTLNKVPEVIDMSHLLQLSKFKLKIRNNTNQIIISSGGGDLALEKTPMLQSFNLQSIVLSDNGLDQFCISAPDHLINFNKMLPVSRNDNSQRGFGSSDQISQEEVNRDDNNLFGNFGWNIREYVVRAKIIHQELNLMDIESQQNRLQSYNMGGQESDDKSQGSALQLYNKAHVYHPLLHSIQDLILLEDGREFMKTHCYCNGKQVGPVFKNQNDSISSNSVLSDYIPQQTNYLPPYTKKNPKKMMKFRFEYHEVSYNPSSNRDGLDESQDSADSSQHKFEKEMAVPKKMSKMIFETNSIQMKYV